MKKSIASILVLLCITTAYGQEWNTSGANIVNSNTGNVGIGYSTPAEKLSVNGGILIPIANGTENGSPGLIGHSNDDFNYNNSGVYINNYGFGFNNYTDGAETGLNSYMSGYYGLTFFTNGSNRLRIARNGNIGVNNPTPKGLIDVKPNGTTHLFRATDLNDAHRWRVTSGFEMFLSDASGAELVKVGQEFSFFSKNVSIGIGWQPKAQLMVGHNLGSSISGYGGGAVFGSNLAVYNSGTNNGSLYTPVTTTTSYGYSGMRAGWGRIDFYSSNANTTEGTVITQPLARLSIANSGNVGIANAQPKAKLHITNLEPYNLDGVALSQDNILFSSNNPGVGEYFGGVTWESGARRRLSIAGAREHTDEDRVGLAFFTKGTDGAGPFAESMRISWSGFVGIGTTTPDQMLTVKGKIHTQEVIVDLLGAVAPDYVFEENYHLLSLEETEAYIEENKHLPEIPSAKEMEENGVQLKEMNLLLLKKIEELTLHLIEQNKLIEKQNERIEKLEKVQSQK